MTSVNLYSVSDEQIMWTDYLNEYMKATDSIYLEPSVISFSPS